MKAETRAHIDRLLSLWRLERAEAARRFQAERRLLSLKERVARGLAARDLRLDETAAAPGGRLLLWLAAPPGALDDLRVGPGDPVRLWWEDPEEPGGLSGVLSRRQGSRLGVVVALDGPQGEEALERLEAGGARLDREAQEATFARGERALRELRDAPALPLREVLFLERDAAFAAPEPWEPLDAALNEPQREAVARALQAQDVMLIHGPPGTGKTRTLVEVIRQALLRGQRVLATASSNTAVDNLAERLLACGVPLVRLGHPARVAPAVEAHALDAQLERHEDHRLARRWMAEAEAIRRRMQARRGRGTVGREERLAALREARALMRDARQQIQGVQEALLRRAPVLCATAAGADAELLERQRFDLVVLDEATQTVDPVALCALARAPRAVLAGDPRQLPPTVLSAEAARGGLGETFFERLEATGGGDALRLLRVQHRMHAELMAFPSQSMYGGRLEAAPEVAGHRLEDLGVREDPLRPGPLLVLDSAGAGWEEERDEREGGDPSTANPGHARRLLAELRRLLARGVAPGDVAVIAAYDAQVRRLRELLRPEIGQGLEVGTVDGFQGREKEAVLVDLVRSNPDARVGFLAETRRTNVAITRARRFLLLLLDSATVGGHPYYGALVAAAEAGGAYRSVFVDDPEG